MKNLLDVYMRPFSKDYPVVCMDESPKQLIKEYQIANKDGEGQEKKS